MVVSVSAQPLVTKTTLLVVKERVEACRAVIAASRALVTLPSPVGVETQGDLALPVQESELMAEATLLAEVPWSMESETAASWEL